ncbi:cephalosporin-c deacetylase [Anopheles sinensis]|uniref:Cephalosporin-c deacetylase n=1 Tax=Anopheles sinensis TaxID=74873 RepID=A0A084WBS7_ANOSI|nr:cephalosporin-c deacetylase [Anopheles sinensis]
MASIMSPSFPSLPFENDTKRQVPALERPIIRHIGRHRFSLQSLRRKSSFACACTFGRVSEVRKRKFTYFGTGARVHLPPRQTRFASSGRYPSAQVQVCLRTSHSWACCRQSWDVLQYSFSSFGSSVEAGKTKSHVSEPRPASDETMEEKTEQDNAEIDCGTEDQDKDSRPERPSLVS